MILSKFRVVKILKSNVFYFSAKLAPKLKKESPPPKPKKPKVEKAEKPEKKEMTMDALIFKPKEKEIILNQVKLPNKLRGDEISIIVKYAVANQVDLKVMEDTKEGTVGDVVPGRELSGVVCGVGEEVKHVKAGDNVVVCPCQAGALCRFCHEQKLEACVKEGMDGIFGITKNGAWAQYTIVPRNFVYKIEEIELDAAALMPLLGQVMCTLSKLNISQEKKVLIQGCGLAGCFFALLLKHNGHEHVKIWEDNPNRVNIIKELCLGYPVITEEELNDCKIDVVISNGSGSYVMTKALKALNNFGEFFIFGEPARDGGVPDWKIDAADISKRSLTIVGSAGTTVNPSKIPVALATKLINPCKLGVPTYPLKEFKEGLTKLTTGDANLILFQMCKENNNKTKPTNNADKSN